MARPRKSIEELKLSGTYQQNKARYADRLSEAPLHTVQTVRFRAPKDFSTTERAAFKEILASCPSLTEADRLLVEVTSRQLAKLRAGTAKPSEANRIMATLEKLRSRAAASAAKFAASTPPPTRALTEREQELKDEIDELIEAEVERRSNLAPPAGMNPKHWMEPATVKAQLFPTGLYHEATAKLRESVDAGIITEDLFNQLDSLDLDFIDEDVDEALVKGRPRT